MRQTGSTPEFFRIVAAALLALACSGAQAATFSAGIENSRWQLSGSIFGCSLEHSIPEYGRAVFHHRAGEELEFFLNPQRNPMRAGQAALVLEQPEWGGGRPVEDLGYVQVDDSHDRPVELEESLSGRLMSSLRDGMRPTFTRKARHSDHPIRVRLNHINFRDQYVQFQQCQSELLPVNFDQVRRTVVLFELDRHRLSDSARQALDDVALYVDADNRVEALYVDGHTDSIGTRLRNRELSRERAQKVTDYLVEQGVPEDMIATRYHADRFPVEGVETPGPRHRRATIRLDREGDADTDDPPTTENIVIVE